MMVASDFRHKVEIWPYHACAMKNMQYNPYLSPKVSYEQFNHWGLGYVADTTFHRRYIKFKTF